MGFVGGGVLCAGLDISKALCNYQNVCVSFSLPPTCESRSELSAISSAVPLLHHHGLSETLHAIKHFFISYPGHGILPEQ